MTLGAINHVQNNGANALLPPAFTSQAIDESYSWQSIALIITAVAFGAIAITAFALTIASFTVLAIPVALLPLLFASCILGCGSIGAGQGAFDMHKHDLRQRRIATLPVQPNAFVPLA